MFVHRARCRRPARGAKNRSASPSSSSGPGEVGDCARPTARGRRSSRQYSAATSGSHNRSSANRVRMPRPPGGCHQCSTSPSANWLGGVPEDLPPRELRPVVDERGGILQLIAEAKGAARLVIRRAAPHAATQILVRQPAVDHEVHGRRGRFDFDGRERLAPELAHDFAKAASRARAVEYRAISSRASTSSVGLAEEHPALRLLGVRAKLEGGLKGGARIEPSPRAPG